MSELKLENVGYRYKNGDRDVLQAVTCTFAPGNLCAVVGPSGSGKTTLLSLMAGLARLTAATFWMLTKMSLSQSVNLLLSI